MFKPLNHSISPVYLLLRIIGAVALLVSIAKGGSRLDEITQLRELHWLDTPIRVNLAALGGRDSSLEFSPDGKYICAAHLPDPPIGDYRKLGLRSVVFDLHGNQISEATDSTGQLVREFIANFPRISWRQKFTDFLSSTEHIDVTLWGFPKNHTNGFRYLRHIELPFSYGTAEFWQFSPEHSKVWSTEIPEKTAEHGMVDFFEDGGQEFVLIAFGGTGAYILSEETGRCIEHFEYRNLDSHGFKSSGQDSRPNLQKNDRNSLSFAPYRFSFDAERGLLACGDANSRMVRIISVERPHKIVFEANLEDNPRQPSGGTWSVSECSFEANGKYLMIGYQYSGRLTDKSYRPVEIFDTSDWHLVMRINDPQITSSILPAISPDAKFLAIIKDGWLEIGGFRENLINLPTASETTIGDKSK